MAACSRVQSDRTCGLADKVKLLQSTRLRSVWHRMSPSKGNVILEPVLQRRQRSLSKQTFLEWDRYFKSIGLSKLGDLLDTPLVEDMVYAFLDNFDLENKSSSVHGRVIHVSSKTFEYSLGASFGSDGKGGSGVVPPNRSWDSPPGWNNRFGDQENARDAQRSDGWFVKALKPEKKDVYQILVRAVLMRCDCAHISNAVATALVKAEEGEENDHGVNWAKYCYDNFIKEMERLARSNVKDIKTVIGQLICKILCDHGVSLLAKHSSSCLDMQPETESVPELSSESGGDSQTDGESIVGDGDGDPGDVSEVGSKRGSKRKAGPLVGPECTNRFYSQAIYNEAQREAMGTATAEHAAMYGRTMFSILEDCNSSMGPECTNRFYSPAIYNDAQREAVGTATAEHAAMYGSTMFEDFNSFMETDTTTVSDASCSSESFKMSQTVGQLLMEFSSSSSAQTLQSDAGDCLGSTAARDRFPSPDSDSDITPPSMSESSGSMPSDGLAVQELFTAPFVGKLEPEFIGCQIRFSCVESLRLRQDHHHLQEQMRLLSSVQIATAVAVEGLDTDAREVQSAERAFRWSTDLWMESIHNPRRDRRLVGWMYFAFFVSVLRRMPSMRRGGRTGNSHSQENIHRARICPVSEQERVRCVQYFNTRFEEPEDPRR